MLIVDEEAPAQQRIADLLKQDAEMGSIAEAADGQTAVQMVLREKPDLVLLDVQMPEMNGLDMMEVVGPENIPSLSSSPHTISTLSASRSWSLFHMGSLSSC